MSNITPTNSTMRSQTTNNFDSLDSPDAVFSSEIFTSEANAVASDDLNLLDQDTAATSAPVSQTPESDFQSQLANLDQRIDRFSEQLDKLDTNFHLMSARLDSLEVQVVSPPAVEPSVAALASQLDARFESLENIFKAQCEMASKFFANAGTGSSNVVVKAEAVVETEVSPELTGLVTETTPVTETTADIETEVAPEAADSETEAVVVASSGDSTSDWQEQRQAMMAKYGFDLETSESEATAPAKPISERVSSMPGRMAAR